MIGRRMKPFLRLFCQDDRGTVSIEFVIIFPIFFSFFLMTVENGIISIRNVMLERGVDIAIRDIRIGTMLDPDAAELRERICEIASIIPDCDSQLQVEMFVRNPRNWTALPTKVNCIDRSVEARPVTAYVTGEGNELVVLRACVRIDPFLPTTGIGKAIVENGDDASGGSYALVSTSSYVVEPR